MIDFIDPHIHLFDLSKGNYHWLRAERAPFFKHKQRIAKSFKVEDLVLSLGLSMRGFVHIEAGFNNTYPWLEIEHIERVAKTTNYPIRTIGCVDLEHSNSNFLLMINKHSQFDSFIGVRHIFDNDAAKILSSKNATYNLRHLNERKLVFELQLNLLEEDGVTACYDVISSLTDIRFILNHAGFVPMRNNDKYKVWRKNINKFAELKNCFCKFSGFEMTQTDYSSLELLRPLKDLISAFSEERVMYASNFPLTLMAKSYQDYWQMLLEMSEAMQLDKKKLFYSNALAVYEFKND